jgi:CRP/FNR family transcriptional regulator, cyclic AMP receptor protein
MFLVFFKRLLHSAGIFKDGFCMKTKYFKKGEEIIKEGMLSDCAYIIDAGQVEVSKKRPNGEKQIIGMLNENDIFGEMGLIDGFPRSATVVALQDCTISIMTQEAFNSLAQHNPEALMPILKVLAKRLRATLTLVEDLQEGKSPP